MNNDEWKIEHLRQHLQYAIQLEYWTIPFYMAAMYSVKDRAHTAYRLVESVVHQEMLHLQLACNVANAFGTTIDLENCFIVPRYEGRNVPHLRFKSEKDPDDPTQSFCPYSAEIGPLDEERINAMCLIEIPCICEGEPELREVVTEYSSIGEFYRAVLLGAELLAKEIRGGRHQVQLFRNFYLNFPNQAVTRDGVDGLADVRRLVHAIVDQGEGERRFDAVPFAYRNTADGFNDDQDHFDKFIGVKNMIVRPETYRGQKDPPESSGGRQAQERLLCNFNQFRSDLVQLFTGQEVREFGSRMATLGGNILSCWKMGVIPRFSEE
jgi:hypothetical protein